LKSRYSGIGISLPPNSALRKHELYCGGPEYAPRQPSKWKAQQGVLSERLVINQFIASAVAEKAAALLTVEYLQARGKRANANWWIDC